MLTIGSLFSGIGGLELGLERSGLGRVIWQVERDEFCRRVLAKHWPDVDRSVTDVRAVATLPRVDLICGGFPCQDVSSAGARVGLAGSRSGLWREFARWVGTLRPEWVVVENVASGARLWADAVVRELEQLGYGCLPIPLSAFDVGAPHRRRRVFIVARNVDGDREPALPEHGEMGGAPRDPAARGEGNSADSHSEQLREQPGRSSGKDGDGKTITSDDCDAVREGREGSGPGAHEERGGPAAAGWRPPVPDVLRVADGLSRGVDRPRRRIAALGNAVVPQCSEVVGWVVRELAGLR